MELTISKIIRWAAGITFLLAALGSLINGQILAAIFCILIAIICIPVIADPVEKSINLKMSGAARFVLVFVLILGMSAVTPHTSQNTVASDVPSNINTASSEAQDSKAGTHATTQNTSEVSSIPTTKNTQEASTIGTKNTKEADYVKTSESPSAEVATPASQAPVYEDDQWIKDNAKFCETLALDFQNIGQDANNGDLDSLYYASMQAKEDLHGVLEADPLYNVSPKYTYARSEWINGLEDSENAMDLIIACKNGGWVDNQKMVDATDLMKQGNAHIDNFKNAIVAA